jgi:signal transduction histidine kinase
VVITLLSLAAAALFVGDTWVAVLLRQPPYTYRTGSWPDLFWFSCYVLLPLAALVRLRLLPAELPSRSPTTTARLTWRDVHNGVRFALPSLAVVLTSAVIVMHATLLAPRGGDLSQPETVGFVLLLLGTLRLAVMYLDQEQLRRERDTARIQEHAMRLANEHMETYLNVVAHELKTPLASLLGYLQLMTRRLDTLVRQVQQHEDHTDAARMLRALIEWSEQSLQRMARLVEDVLDETRVRQGRFALRLQPTDLVSVVGHAVGEQLALNPERSIHWVVEAPRIPVLADAGRIEQVVTNYVSNALKFSRADQAVEVRIRTDETPETPETAGATGAMGAAGTHKEARVSVHDEGVGIPLAEQPRIWERFYQAEGTDVQSGSQVGFGIGLYISKAIIEGHHGAVGVESAPGQGTTFWFTLPLAAPPSAPPSAPTAPASTSVSGEDDARTSASEPEPNDHERSPD